MAELKVVGLGKVYDLSKAKLELKRLSEIYVICPDPSAVTEREKLFPGYYSHWCRSKCVWPDLGLLDCITLVHSPQGCIGTARDFLLTYFSQYHGTPFFNLPSTDMNRSDAILGGEDKLRASILEADRMYKPRVMFLAVSCCAGVIQDPVEDVAREMEPLVGAEKIVVMRLEGFCHYATGEANVYGARRLAEELMEEPKKKIPRSVNILGQSKEVHYKGAGFLEDSMEMGELLERLGLTINSVLLQSVTLEAYKRAPEAEFNTLICPQRGLPMATYMEDMWEVPHGKRFNPIGVTPTINWIMEVAEFFGLEREAREMIDEEYSRIKDKWEEAKRLVEGKIALVDGGDAMTSLGRTIAWSRFCVDLGMHPVIFNIPGIEAKAKFHHALSALGEGFDPELIYLDYAYHRRISPMTVIEGLGLNFDDVGLYMGDVYPTAMVKEWTEPIFDPSNSPRLDTCSHVNRQRGSPIRRTGFRGALAIATDIINAIGMAKRKAVPTLYGRIGAL